MMSKTLSHILTVFKIARIVAKVVSILCLVGAVGCLIALTTLPIVGAVLPAEILAEEQIELATAYPACMAGMIVCVAEAVLAWLAERYFGHVLQAGTPFTLDGAKECFRLGLVSIIVSGAASVMSGMVSVILSLLSMDASGLDADLSMSLTTGVLLLFVSLLFKYGAELQAPTSEAFAQEEPDTETKP